MSAMEVETPSDFSNDLLLLDRVFLRIGNADTDEQLENCLNKFLPPVILKLSSPNEQVRTKVMELLVHVNKRVRCRSEVQLPVRTLLQQYRDPNATNFVVNFAIIYITMGFPRLPRDQQLELVPEVLNAITSRPQSHQDGILILLMPLLGDVNAKNLDLKENVVLSRLVVRFATDILLLPYRALPGNSSEGSEFQVPPGMSLRSYKRITAKNVFTAAQLEEMKTSIVKFIEKDVIKGTDVLLPLIVAAADSRFNVANMANSPLARVASSVDWTSSATVAPLYGLYLGLGGGRAATAEDKRAPACTRLRLKLLPYLNRSSGAAVMFPHSMQVIFTSLFDENSNSRLKNLAISYTLIVINGGELEQLKQVAGVLLEGVLKVVRSAEFHEHHPRAFTCVGRLAMRVPSCVNSQFGILEEFVGKLPEASPELKTGIRDALLDMSHAFKIPHTTKKKEEPMEVVSVPSSSQQADEKMEVEGEASSTAVKGDMEDVTQQLTLIALLDQYLQRDDPMIRYVATRYAASVFPSDSVPSRYLLLLASGDSKDEVSMEALKALYGVTRPSEIEDIVNNVSNSDQGPDVANVAIPPFSELVEYLWSQMERRKRGSNAKHRFVIQNQVLPFHPVTYNEMVRYMRASLVRVAGLKECSAHPCSQTPLLAKYVRESLVDRPALKHYVSMLTSLMVAVPDVMPLTGLLDIIGCVPDKMAAEYAVHLPFFRNLLTTSTKEEVRDVSASLYATILIWSNESPKQVLSEASELVGRCKAESSLETRCGLAGAAARMAEGCLRRYGTEVGDRENVTAVVVELANMLSSGNNLLVGSACSNLALLARCMGLPIPDSSPTDASPGVSKQALLGQLFEVVTNAKFSSKTKEKALSALGLLCVGERFPFAKKIVQGFLDMAKDTKEFEIHLAIGESLVLCVEGIESDERRDAWCESPRQRESVTTPRDSDVRRENDALLVWLLQELLKLAVSPHPNSKQATSIWLLAVTRGCCYREPVKGKLPVIQEAFMDFLSENSDIVQDVASKGLSIVYTASEESEKQQLVGQLIEQLAGGRRRVQQVTSETRLFEEGQLGQSPTGGNLSTYKELCSLASDLNQPDLLYKFMHLAHHNSMWNSKKGAAFGFQTISLQAGAQLAQYLPKIVPRLYRYRFDPTPRIQNSMSSIWQALVTDTHQTVEKYHSEILDDLVVNLTSAQWRVRMSCCHAVADLMRTVPGMDRWRSHLVELWKQLFRVMDDVHEGTRLAANTTSAMLSKMCIRAVEEGKSGNEVLAAILPVLLDTGITHLVKEVRNISLTTVSGVVDDPQVRPWLPRLVPALLAAAGDLEPAALAQLSTTLGASSDARAAVDTARTSLVKQHVTTKTVTRAVPYLDATALKELAPAVLELTRSPQLGCRAAAAYFWQICAAQVRGEFAGLAPRVATGLLTAARERNVAARSVAVAALPHVISCAKPSSVDKLVERIVSWYEECESQNESPEAIAHVLRALASHDAELLRQRAVRLAPLVFLAMHAPPGDQDAEKTAEIFAEVWSEISPGRETMLRAHLSTVSQNLQVALGSRNRTTKLQAAEAVKTLCTRLGSAVEPERAALLAALKPAITGTLYPGKHSMMYALAALTNVKPSETPVDPAFVEECARIVLSECTRKDPTHSRHALLALAEIPLPPAIFTGLYDIVKDILAKEESAINKDSDDEDGSERSGKRDQLRQLKEAAYQLLGQAWPEDPQTQNDYGLMVLTECASRYESSTRSTRVAMLAAAQRVLRRGLITADSTFIVDRVTALLNTAFRCSTEARLRSSALTIMHYTAVQLKEMSKTSELDALRAILEQHLPELSRNLLTAPEVSCRLDQVKEALR